MRNASYMSNLGHAPLRSVPPQGNPAAPPAECEPRLCDYAEWRAEEYFGTYYAGAVLPDERRVLAYQLGLLEAQPTPFGRALEYGCGPTLHRAIAASRYALSIDMADRVGCNLAQIRAWLKAGPENTDWNACTRYLLACEGDHEASARRVEGREAHTREVIRELRVSDVRSPDPLGGERRGFYDLIVSGFCIEAVSQDPRVWRECMLNLLSMLCEGGLLILHALAGCSAYRVAERLYPCAELGADDLRECLAANGFVRATIDVAAAPCPENARYGYDSVLMASGRKARRRSRSAAPKRAPAELMVP